MVSKPKSSKRIGTAFGLALLASLALGSGVIAPASASAAAPENITLPVISPTEPKVAQVATTTTGTWNGKPTSYTFAWQRCNSSGGECAAISGATSSSYTPTSTDLGHALVTAVTASNASGSNTAYSKPTSPVAPSGPLSWYACKNVGAGSGLFEDAACSKEGGTKAFAWTKLATKAPTGFKTSGTSGFTLELVFGGGILVTISCSGQASESTIENQSYGKGGTIGALSEAKASFILSGCTVTKPAGSGCAVPAGTLHFEQMAGEATEFEGKPALKLSPLNAEGRLITFKIEGCSGGAEALNGEQAVKGTFTGIANSSTSSLEFTKASSKITHNGIASAFAGTSKMETTAGEALKLAL